MPRDTGPFRVGERVLVPHTDKYYEAKALKAEKRNNGQWYYLLHYQGWNKKWDEWVEAGGLVKYDKKLAKSAAANGEGPGGGPGGSAGRKKRKLDDFREGKELSPIMGEKIVVDLPATLKRVLVADHEAVAGGGRLAPLPRKPCVNDVLTQYADATRPASSDLVHPEEEVATGLRIYFDKALPHLLLYESEAKQGEKVLADGQVPSSVYGAEHLLRLLHSLPDLVPTAHLTQEGFALLETRVAEVVAFLHKHAAQLFLQPESYITAR